jgi:hypothetical protein
MLGCRHKLGFADCLSNAALPLTDLVLCTSHANLSFLPAGKPVAGARPSLDDTRGFLTAAKQHYDFTVLCGGAVMADPGSLAIAPAVGRVLLLAIENETKIEDLDSARDALHFCKVDRVGLVLTSVAR